MKKQVENLSQGFFVDDLERGDLNIFKDLIFNHFDYLLKLNNISNVNFNNYLENQNIINHEKIFTKQNRLLPKKSVEEIINKTSLFKVLRKNFKNLFIIDEENIKYPNIYWRLVRPSPYKDISSLHKDIWYWDLWEDKIDYSKYNRIKLWVAITGNNENLGFCFIKNSVNKTFNYKSEIRQGKLKPTFQNDLVKEKDKISLCGNAGKFIIFNENLLHGGELLHSTKPRLSCEFAMIYEIK